MSIALLHGAAPSQVRRARPPVPAAEYDPIPGPFFATVDQRGAVEDPGVISNAIASWTGAKLGAFTLCYAQGEQKVDWRRALQSLEHVARDLNAKGAAVVVIQATRLCSIEAIYRLPRRPFVAITGVLRTLE